MDSTIKTSTSERTECQSHRSSTNKCSQLSKQNTVKRWTNTEMKCSTPSSSSTPSNQKKTQFRTRSKRSFKSALRTRLYSATPSSQPTILRSTQTQSIHRSTRWICLWLNGRDHRRSVHRALNHACSETKWVLEISNKEFWAIAGFLAHSLFSRPIQSSWQTWLFMMELSMDLQSFSSLKMEGGKMLLLTLEFLLTLSLKHLFMVIAMT